MLFLLFINDLPISTNKFSFNLYADDTVVYKSGCNINSLVDQYDTDIHEVTEWYTRNKLTLNVSKTEILLLGPQKAKAPEKLKFSEENICQSNSVKYLGIHIDSDLSWNNQFKHIESKACQYTYTYNIHILNKLKHILTQSQLLTIYNTVIEPTIHYCDAVWGYSSLHNINRMNRLKRRSARAITNNYDWDIRGSELLTKYTYI